MAEANYKARLREDLIQSHQRKGKRLLRKLLTFLSWCGFIIVLEVVLVRYSDSELLPYLLIGLLIIPASSLGVDWMYYGYYPAQIRNLEAALSPDEARDEVASRHLPVSLYLRGFSGTSFPHRVEHPGDTYGHGWTFSNSVEQRLMDLLEPSAVFLKLHALTDSDPNPRTCCIRVLCDNNTWIEDVTDWAERSALIVIDPSGWLHSGLFQECELIRSRPELCAKTVMIATRNEIASIEASLPDLVRNIRWFVLINSRELAEFRSFDLPVSLYEHLNRPVHA